MHLKKGLTLERKKFHNETTYYLKYSLIVVINVRIFYCTATTFKTVTGLDFRKHRKFFDGETTKQSLAFAKLPTW